MNKKKHRISFSVILGCFAFSLLIGLLFPFRTVQAVEYASTKECLQLLSERDPEQFVSLDHLNITNSQFLTIQNFCRELTAADTTDEAKIRRVYDWIINYSFKDTLDAPADGVVQDDPVQYNDPYHMFKYKRGVCQGYSHLFRTMMTALGIPSVVVNGNLHDPSLNYLAHAWNFVYCDGQWGIADTAWRNLYLNEDISAGYDLYEVHFLASKLYSEGVFDYGYYYGFSIMGYNGNAAEITLPESFQGKTVTGVDFRAFTSDKLEKITIPKTVQNGIVTSEYNNPNPFGTNSLKEFVVAPDNPSFSSYSGILYNKDFSKIILVPRSIEEVELKAQAALDKETLNLLPNLRRLKIADGTERIESYAIELCPSLAQISIPASVTYIAEDAFSECGTAVIYAPEGSAGAAYAAANGLELKDPSLYNTGDDQTEKPTEPEKPVVPIVPPDPAAPDVPDKPTDQEESEKVPATDNTADNTKPVQDPGSNIQTPAPADTDVSAPTPAAPKKVTGIQVSYKKTGKAIVSWKKIKGAAGYQLFRKQNGKWSKVKTIRKGTRVTLKQAAKKSVQYRIRAYKKSGKTAIYGTFSRKFKIAAKQ